MEITEVRVKLMDDSDDRLQAFCSITFDDCFVVRDLKIIEGSNGYFVAMPSRKLTAHCGRCGAKNHLRSAYCNHCGAKSREERQSRDQDGRSKLYADIAHPINSDCREMIQDRVITEFESEMKRSEEPGYLSRYDDSYGESDGEPAAQPAVAKTKRGEHAHLESAEKEPRAPHTPPGKSDPGKSDPSQSRRSRTQRPESKKNEKPAGDDTGFGDGVFE